jgi:hypothetical protein
LESSSGVSKNRKTNGWELIPEVLLSTGRRDFAYRLLAIKSQ